MKRLYKDTFCDLLSIDFTSGVLKESQCFVNISDIKKILNIFIFEKNEIVYNSYKFKNVI